MMSKLHEGDKINHWTLIKEAPKPLNYKTNLIYWVCECDCHEKTRKIISENALINNKTKSCGCHRLKDLRSTRIGQLEVLDKDIETSREKGETYWRCKCDCGTIKSISNSHLTGKNPTLSCGCLRLKKVKEKCQKYNTFNLSGDYGIGYTSNNKEFYFDKEDFDKIKEYNWHINKSGYVVSHNLRMNRVVMQCEDKEYVVDHINHNPLDNRKENLRICSQQHNTKNSSLRSNNTSGVTGVYRTKNKTNPWTGEIMNNGIKAKLGNSCSFNDMVMRRIAAECMLFKDFSPHYIPASDTYEIQYLNPDDKNYYKMTMVKPTSTSQGQIEIKEISRDEYENKDRWI